MSPAQHCPSSFRAVVALFALCGGLMGCEAEAEPSLELGWLPANQLDLGVVGRDETLFDFTQFTVLNEGYFDVEIEFARLGGDAVVFLEEREDPGGDQITPRSTWSVGVRVKPLFDEDRRRWSTQDLSGTLSVRVSGLWDIDNLTGVADPASRLVQDIEVPIVGSINCDFDGDGFDDAVCGGNDCDDEAPQTNPATPEYCDLIDNNCDGDVDGPGCIEV